MKLSDISIRRPVFATMMIGALLVVGAFSYTQLPVELMPDVDFPFVIVNTVYPGASAEAVETDVTETIEEAVNTISGVRHIQSRSREGFSNVVVEFELDVDGAQAADETLHQHPYQAIAIGVGIGALIGYLVAHRCFRNGD